MRLTVRRRIVALAACGLLPLSFGCTDQGDQKQPAVVVPPEDVVDPGDDGADPGDDGGGAVDTGGEDTGGAGTDTGDSGGSDDDPCDTSIDADCDGLPDSTEVLLGSDLNSAMSDGDSLTDYDEFVLHLLNPVDRDTDGDGLDDDQELLTRGTHPRCRDTDGDGIIDGDDTDPGSAEDGLATDCVDWWVTVFPIDPDADDDGDGLTNFDESVCGTLTDDWDSDDDTLSDSFECGDSRYDPRDDNSDTDALFDNEEHAAGTDPSNPDTDGDGLDDYAEVHGPTDPIDDDSDDDLLIDGDEVAGGCDPMLTDSDEDGLSDYEESLLLTDCTLEDTDGGGMPDGLEVASGKDPLAHDIVDADTGASYDYAWVGVNEVWACTSMRTETVTEDTSTGVSTLTFTLDVDHYGTLVSELGVYSQFECVCDDVFVAEVDDVQVSGVTVWTEQAVHTTDIGSAYRAYQGEWSSAPVATAAAVTPAWASQVLSEYDDTYLVAGALEVGLDSDGDAAWMAFDSSYTTADGLQTSSAVPVSGAVDVRVSFGNIGEAAIEDCGELTYVPATSSGDDHGLQFRVDAISMAAMAPPSALPPSDAMACRGGDTGSTRLGFLPASGGGRTPIPVGGALRYGHAALTKVAVQDWRGSDWVTLTHSDGRQLLLTPAHPAALLPEGAPWTLGNTAWKMGRDREGAFSEPIVDIQHHCTGLDAPPPGPVPVDSYALTFDQVDTIATALGAPGLLSKRWPGLTQTDRSLFRARVIVPDAWVDGPTQARLRIDVAGGPTALSLPLDPVLEPALRTMTPPHMVRTWIISRASRHHEVEAQLQQSPSGLTVVLSTLRIGDGDHLQLQAPVHLTLAPE